MRLLCVYVAPTSKNYVSQPYIWGLQMHDLIILFLGSFLHYMARGHDHEGLRGP